MVVALTSATLQQVWRSELGGAVVSDLVPNTAGLALVTRKESPETDDAHDASPLLLRVLSRETGVPLWSSPLPTSQSAFIGSGNGSLIVVTSGGAAMAFDALTGRVKWQISGLGTIEGRPRFSANELVIGTAEKRLVMIKPATGTIALDVVHDFPITAVDESPDDAAALGDRRGNAFLVDAKGARTGWKFKSGAAVSSITATGDGTLLTSLDNFIYFISDRNGDVIWKRRLSGRVVERPLLLGERLVSAIPSENSIFVLDRKTGRLLDAFTGADHELVSSRPVAAGPDELIVATTSTVDLYGFAGCRAAK